GLHEASEILVWRVACVLADLEAGNEAEAREAFDAIAANGFRDLPQDFFAGVALAMLAEVCAGLGDQAGAAALYEVLLPARGQFVLLAIGVLCMGSVSYYLGLLALTRGAWSDAEELLTEAVDANGRVGGLPMVARSRLAYLRLLRARDAPGDRERAGSLREQVITDAGALG